MTLHIAVKYIGKPLHARVRESYRLATPTICSQDLAPCEFCILYLSIITFPYFYFILFLLKFQYAFGSEINMSLNSLRNVSQHTVALSTIDLGIKIIYFSPRQYLKACKMCIYSCLSQTLLT